MSDRDKRLSKFLSYVLRHKPEDAGLTLDERGCCPVDTIIQAASTKLGHEVTRDDIELLCEPSDDPKEKTRFELEGDLIRAGHGHSIPVAGLRPCEPKGPLYHATTKTALPKVKTDGLKCMSRQKVHLSYDKAITIEAARRRSRDIVLVEVETGPARLDNIGFYESADPRIVLSDDIPAKYLRFPS